MALRSIFPRVAIHSEYYYRDFLTKTCTTGYCFSVVIYLIVIFLPFFSTYSTGCKYASSLVSSGVSPLSLSSYSNH